MAHFYFDVCTNGVTVEDQDGVDLLKPPPLSLKRPAPPLR